MKLYEGLVLVLVAVATLVASFWFGMDFKEASMIREQAKIKEVAIDTRKQAMEGAADAISKIVIRNTTIQGKVETVIRDNPVYRDCKHDDASLQLINQAITGRTGSTGDSSVPGANTAK